VAKQIKIPKMEYVAIVGKIEEDDFNKIIKIGESGKVTLGHA
jgi:hypothetical protein